MTTNSSPSRPRGAYLSDIERAVGVASSLRLRRPLRRVASPATPLVAALPLVTRSSLATPPQVRERALLAMRFASEAGSRRRIPTRGRSITYALATGIWRRRAAYRGTRDGTQHRRRHPGGTGFKRRDSLHAERSTSAHGAVARSLRTIRSHSALGYRPPAPEIIVLGEELPMNHEAA